MRAHGTEARIDPIRLRRWHRDSEVIANAELADIVTELGVPTTLEDSYRLYMGKRFADVNKAIEVSVGKSLPEGFAPSYQARTLNRFRRDLRFATGAREHIAAFPNALRCIASSSSPDRLAICLEVLCLQAEFGGKNVFSGSSVARGKPHPDIFLHAARQMGIDPSRCLVIEDSPSGVEAGRAAGMTVIGLLAASHIQPSHPERLRQAGAQHIAATFAEAQRITGAFLAVIDASL